MTSEYHFEFGTEITVNNYFLMVLLEEIKLNEKSCLMFINVLFIP